jgi:hypothetical protein
MENEAPAIRDQERRQLDWKCAQLLYRIADGPHGFFSPELRQALCHEAADILAGRALSAAANKTVPPR